MKKRVEFNNVLIIKMANLNTADLFLRSVNAREITFPTKWMVYFTMLKGKKATHVHDCTGLHSPVPLLLFGGNSVSLVTSASVMCPVISILTLQGPKHSFEINFKSEHVSGNLKLYNQR